MDPRWIAVRAVLRWVGAAFITYEAAGLVEEVGDKFPDVVYDASTGQVIPDPTAKGPWGLGRGGVVAVVLVAAAIAYGLARVGKMIKL